MDRVVRAGRFPGSRVLTCVASKCANREVPGDDVSDSSVSTVSLSTDFSESELENETVETETERVRAYTTAKQLDATFELPHIKFTTPNRCSRDLF